jgi:hypothetical protein
MDAWTEERIAAMGRAFVAGQVTVAGITGRLRLLVWLEVVRLARDS